MRAEEILRKSIEAVNERVIAPSGGSRQLDVTPALGFELREWHKLWTELALNFSKHKVTKQVLWMRTVFHCVGCTESFRF